MSSVFASVWSFILTLVRSLLALFSFRRRTDIRTSNDTLARAHSRLRPIILTPRSIPLSHPQRVQGTRFPSATSTLFHGHPDIATASSQASAPQRTSSKLDALDPELGLPVTACDLPGPPAASAASFREGTPDTSHTGSSSCVAPLTPPDRCHLAPLPSTTDCPYAEPWPADVPIDRGKPKLPGSPLRLSTNTNTAFPVPMVARIGSPPPGRWSPVQIWTSTPSKNDDPAVPDQAHTSLEVHKDSSALANISHALISRSQSSIKPYDDASLSPVSLDASPLVDFANGPGPTHEHRRAQAYVPRTKDNPYPRFHHPDAYACAWRRHGARLPGKTSRAHGYARSLSHVDLAALEWYNADAYALSPVAALSPPLGEDEDEEELPLDRVRERLARQSLALGFLSTAMISPRTARRMSEGCLLALSESTPTRVGVNTRSGRHAISLALEGDGREVKDWLEALSLRFSSEPKDTVQGGKRQY